MTATPNSTGNSTRGPSALQRCGAVVGLAAGVALAFGLIANEIALADYGLPRDSADYIAGPVELSRTVVVAATLIGLMVVVAAIAAIVRAGSGRQMLVPMALGGGAGFVAGGSFALIVAPSAGANIGGGGAMLFGRPLAAALLITALVLAWSRPQQIER